MKLLQTLSRHPGAGIGLGAGLAMAGLTFYTAIPSSEEITRLKTERAQALVQVASFNGERNSSLLFCALLDPPVARGKCIENTDKFFHAQESLDRANKKLTLTIYASVILAGFIFAIGVVVDMFLAWKNRVLGSIDQVLSQIDDLSSEPPTNQSPEQRRRSFTLILNDLFKQKGDTQ